jgi:hypothetical protein
MPLALERVVFILLGGGDAGVFWIDANGHVHIDPGNNPETRRAISELQAAASLSKVQIEGAAELGQKLAMQGMKQLAQGARGAGA